MPDLFPAFLKLAGRRVVVVGGGAVALAKLGSLLQAGCQVAVVAPEICAGIEGAGVELARRPFAASDLDGAWFAVAAAPPPVNRAVAAAAASRRIFVNAVDDLEAGSSYLGGVLRRGGVTVAISTAGRAPALAGLLREALDHLLPVEVGGWVETAAAARRGWRAAGIPMARRRPLLLQALNDLYAAREQR